MVPPDSIGISRVPTYSGALPNPYSHFGYGTLTLSRPPFQARSPMLSGPFRRVPQPPPAAKPVGLGSSAFARRYSQNLSFDFFSSGYLDVSVPRVGSLSGDRTSPAGFPHSDISGSSLACSSPKLFAACHVLLRRLVPRHPPCALIHLTSNTFAFSAQDFVGLPRSSVDAQQCASFLARRPPTPASETARSCLMAVGRWSLRDFAPFPHTRFTVS